MRMNARFAAVSLTALVAGASLAGDAFALDQAVPKTKAPDAATVPVMPAPAKTLLAPSQATSEAPLTTAAAATTEAPVTTTAAATSEAPLTAEAAATGEAPVATLPPAATQTPVTAATSEAPAAGNQAIPPKPAELASMPGKAWDYATQTRLLRVSDQAMNALHEVHAARLALFDGKPDRAEDQVTRAWRDFAQPGAMMAEMSIVDTANAHSAERFVPISLTFGNADKVEMTAADVGAMDRAYRLMSRGAPARAVETLKTADANAELSAVLLPVNGTQNQLADARRLIGERKYYEASLALKAIEDSVVTRSYALNRIPQQGESD